MKKIVLAGDVGFEITFEGLVETFNSKEIEDGDDIEIRLLSMGGDVFQGEAVYAKLASHPGKVTIFVDSIAASAASLIAMAADELVMGPNAYLMVHKPWTMTRGNSDQLRGTLKVLTELEERYVQAYKSKAGDKLTEDKIRDLMTANGGDGEYISAKEAVRMGLADRIDGKLTEARVLPTKFADAAGRAPIQIAARLKHVMTDEEKQALLEENIKAAKAQSRESSPEPEEEPEKKANPRVAELRARFKK